MKNDFIINVPEYNEIGIYALVDDAENMYIGSSKHISKRINQHNQQIKSGTENKKILQAIANGHNFHCEIIEKLNYGICRYDINKKETEYIRKLKPFYNISPGSYMPPEFHLECYNDALNKGNLKTSEYWLDMHQRLSMPIFLQSDDSRERSYSINPTKKLKRIPLDVQKEKYEEIKAAADANNESVNGYIKKAIDMRLENDTM